MRNKPSEAAQKALEAEIANLTETLLKEAKLDKKAAAAKAAKDFKVASEQALIELTGKFSALGLIGDGTGTAANDNKPGIAVGPIDSLDTLLTRFSGQWAEIRDAYQRGEVPEPVMKDLVGKRRAIIDALADLVVADLYGDEATQSKEKMWMAVGSDKLTSDYDISFLGPKAELAVMVFNARFAAGWGTVGKLGGIESAGRLDTNVYTDPAFRQFVGSGSHEMALQEAASYAAARKFMTDENWATFRKTVLAAAPEGRQAGLASILDRVEIGQLNANRTIVDKAGEIAQSRGRAAPTPDDFIEAQN